MELDSNLGNSHRSALMTRTLLGSTTRMRAPPLSSPTPPLPNSKLFEHLFFPVCSRPCVRTSHWLCRSKSSRLRTSRCRTAERNVKHATTGTPLRCIRTRREGLRSSTGCSTGSCKSSRCLSSVRWNRASSLVQKRVTICSLRMVSRLKDHWRLCLCPADPPRCIGCADPMYFPGRAANIYYRRSASAKEDQAKQDTSAVKALEGTQSTSSPLDTVAKALKSVLPGSESAEGSNSRDLLIGSLGILHPTVLQNYSILNPCSSVEINIEPFL